MIDLLIYNAFINPTEKFPIVLGSPALPKSILGRKSYFNEAIFEILVLLLKLLFVYTLALRVT